MVAQEDSTSTPPPLIIQEHTGNLTLKCSKF